mmetsp:Transcript_12668/g.10829  ORF Transcript_12668/g.10829 Transcript_12668/m.10829 type:complete len:90 (+) Transcript_12668:174-443(+)
MRHFLFVSQAIVILFIIALLVLNLMRKSKTGMLGFGITGLIISFGYLVTLTVVEISDYLQLYSGKVHILPSHPSSWFTILDTVVVICFI